MVPWVLEDATGLLEGVDRGRGHLRVLCHWHGRHWRWRILPWLMQSLCVERDCWVGLGYGADMFAVYDATGFRLTEVLDAEMGTITEECGLPQQLGPEIRSRDEAALFEPGFVTTPSGALELYIVPVQPQEDRDRTGQHYGYLAVGRYWKDSLLTELEGLTGAEIQMVESSLPAMQSRPRQWTGEIHFSRSLNGLDGEPLYHLDVTMPLPVADRVISKQVEAFWVILTGTAVAVLLVIAFVLHWVSRPVKFLSDSLESGRTERLEQLMKTTS